MSRYLMKISYDGTIYHGWQVQKKAVTVQECVQDALELVFGFRPNVTGCSRTDSGVHAIMFCLHFDVKTNMQPNNIIKAINSKLPEDISAYDCSRVADDFHARYSVKSKQYKYKFYCSEIRNPFYNKYSMLTNYSLDIVKLNNAAKQFVGTYDFSSFCSTGTSVEDKKRTVFSASVEKEGDFVVFKVRANGFLYNMVRIMAGTLLYVAMGKINENEIKDIILAKSRERAGITAPAQGLYLECVEY